MAETGSPGRRARCRSARARAGSSTPCGVVRDEERGRPPVTSSGRSSAVSIARPRDGRRSSARPGSDSTDGSAATRLAQQRVDCTRLAAPDRSNASGVPSRTWLWLSMNPGRTSPPLASTSTVSGPIRSETMPSSPTSTMSAASDGNRSGARMRVVDRVDAAAAGCTRSATGRSMGFGRYFFFAALRSAPRSAAWRLLGVLLLALAVVRPAHLRSVSSAHRHRSSVGRSVLRGLSRPRPRRRPARARRCGCGRVDRVQERRAHAGLLEMTDRGDRGATRRRHHLAKLDRVLARVAQHLRGAEHRLDDQLGRHVAREPEQDAGLDHRLGEQEEVRGTAAARRRDGVEVRLLQPEHPSRRSRAAPRRREVLVLARARRPLTTDIASSTRTATFDITRTTGTASGRCFSTNERPDAGREAHDEVVRRHVRRDLLEERLHVLGLHHQDERVRLDDRLGVRTGSS